MRGAKFDNLRRAQSLRCLRRRVQRHVDCLGRRRRGPKRTGDVIHLEGEFRGEIPRVAFVCVAGSSRQKIEAGQDRAAPHANVLEAGRIASKRGADVPRELISPYSLAVLRRQIILRESQCHALRRKQVGRILRLEAESTITR
jgi:hypothetical protein